MPYLIDGHNLIPKLGLRLDDPEDEIKLGAILQDFARVKRQQMEVYFDGAPVGQAGTRKLGTVKAHFVRQGQTADAAIRARLNTMGKSARNWIVVSSDHEVQHTAKVHQAQCISSEEFFKQLRSALQAPQKSKEDTQKLSTQEVDEWLRIFGEGKQR